MPFLGLSFGPIFDKSLFLSPFCMISFSFFEKLYLKYSIWCVYAPWSICKVGKYIWLISHTSSRLCQAAECEGNDKCQLERKICSTSHNSGLIRFVQKGFDLKLRAAPSFMLFDYIWLSFIWLVMRRPFQDTGIFIHPWLPLKMRIPRPGWPAWLVSLAGRIKGEGTPEAAVFSETQFEADQNGT